MPATTRARTPAKQRKTPAQEEHVAAVFDPCAALTDAQRRRQLAVLLVGPLLPAAAIAYAHFSTPTLRSPGAAAKLAVALVAVCVTSLLGFWVTRRAIPVLCEYMHKRGNCGKDINKRGTAAGERPIPESLGLACGLTWLTCTIGLQQLVSSGDLLWGSSSSFLVEYNAALLCVCFMLLLGFVDDMLDIPWRYKLALPFVAAMPLLVAYAGHTSVVVPGVVRAVLTDKLGFDLSEVEFLHLGPLYYVYIAALAVFCTNSINIHAGVNGLEAGQSLILAAAVVTLNVQSLSRLDPAGGADDARAYESHLLSVFLVLPFYATTAALLAFNWFPSKVFVGDTYTYFAGMTFAVSGILGHFSETLLLFFLPQVANFLYSVPQLLKLPGFPCPRHRLPSYDPATGLLRPTNVLSGLWSAEAIGSPPMNGNLVNLALRWGGNCSENALCIRLLALQALCAVAAFAARAALADTSFWKS